MMRSKYEGPVYVGFLVCVMAAVLGVFLALQTAVPLADATSTNTVGANVQVSGYCWTLTSPNPITFSDMPPSTSMSTSLPVTDSDVGGNMDSWLWIKGNDWSNTLTSNTIGVGSTLWSQTSMATYTGNALTTNAANTVIYLAAPTQVSPTNSVPVYFGLSVPGGTPSGIYTQSITFNNLCTDSTATSNSIVVTANVNVLGVCYTSVAPTLISFGTMAPGSAYNTNVVVTDTDAGGNYQAALYVEADAANWVSGLNNIAVGNTVWSASSQVSYTGTALTTTFANTLVYLPAPTIAGNTVSNSIYFGMNVPGGTPSGLYTVNIILENSC